jgi:hypothetical protein
MNDGHDSGIDGAAKFLGPFVQKLSSNAEFMKKTLIVITFDEDDYFHIWSMLQNKFDFSP